MARESLAAKPRNDAYTILLSLSLMAMLAACALLYNDLKRYPSVTPGANFAPPADVGGANQPPPSP
jgi:hypothetical protein